MNVLDNMLIEANKRVRDAIKNKIAHGNVNGGYLIETSRSPEHVAAWKYQGLDIYVLPVMSKIVVDGVVYDMDEDTKFLVSLEVESDRRYTANKLVCEAIQNRSPYVKTTFEVNTPPVGSKIEDGWLFYDLARGQGCKYVVLYNSNRIVVFNEVFLMNEETRNVVNEEKKRIEEHQQDGTERIQRAQRAEQIGKAWGNVAEMIKGLSGVAAIAMMFLMLFTNVGNPIRTARSAKKQKKLANEYTIDSIVRAMDLKVAKFQDSLGKGL